MKKFWAVFVARNLEFFRDRSTLIFNLVMPMALIFGFAFAFPGGGGTTFKIGVVGEAPAAGSAAETGSALRLARVWGYVDGPSVAVVEALLDRVLAMLWRLTHGPG